MFSSYSLLSCGEFLKRLICLGVIYSILFGIAPVSVFPIDPVIKSLEIRRLQKTSFDESDKPKGLQFRLSNGKLADEKEVEKVAEPVVEPLSLAETDAVLRRMPEFKPNESGNNRETTGPANIPPPRLNGEAQPAFETAANPSVKAPMVSFGGKLEVVRCGPTGDVDAPAQLSVTFSQPMVPVGSNREAQTNLPVRLSPEPPGRWRWIGTNTLMFVPENGFPKSTKYSVTIPKGTQSINGGVLNDGKEWVFTTPTLKIKRSYPSGDEVTRKPLIFIEFDQEIDREEVIQHVSVQAQSKHLRVRPAADEEIKANDEVSKLIASAAERHWIAVRVVRDSQYPNGEDLRPGERVVVTIGRGTGSIEGPVKMAQSQTFTFSTYEELSINRAAIRSWETRQPHEPWYVNFNNSLDAASIRPENVIVDPAIGDMKINATGKSLTIAGTRKENSDYRVTLKPDAVRDLHDQPLKDKKSITFKVGEYKYTPTFSIAGGEFFVLDPVSIPEVKAVSVGFPKLNVSLYAVGPEHWQQYLELTEFIRHRNRPSAKNVLPPGRLVRSAAIEFPDKGLSYRQTRIDLSPALNGKHGQALVVVESPETPYGATQTTVSWVQVTDIGLDAFADKVNLVGWVTSIKDARPLDNVTLNIWLDAQVSVTAADGIARLSLPVNDRGTPKLLVARRGDDLAILPEIPPNHYVGRGRWSSGNAAGNLLWHVFDDRQMYRPGEEVHIKGWLRKLGAGGIGDVEGVGGGKTISYILKDGAKTEIANGTMTTNAFGGFDTRISIPTNANLGEASLDLKAAGIGEYDGDEEVHSFQIQEFRRPEYEVAAKLETEGPFVINGNAEVSIEAKYFSGGPLQDANVNWWVSSNETKYTPPNRSEYTFGKWTSWWSQSGGSGSFSSQTFFARTDSVGKHQLKIDFDAVNPARPMSVYAQATVVDKNRQSFAASSTMLVHPSSHYVGLRSNATFVQPGETFSVEGIVTDIDGSAIDNREITMISTRQDWKYEKNRWTSQYVEPKVCTIRTGAGPVSCLFTNTDGGNYRIIASIKDDKGRPNETELNYWVADEKWRTFRSHMGQESVELIPRQKTFKAGDTAEVLVRVPFYPAEGLMSLRRGGLLFTEHFKIDGPSHILRFPIQEDHTPNVHLQVDIVGQMSRRALQGISNTDIPKQPAFASGTLNIPVPPENRKLSVIATPGAKVLEPGDKTSVKVDVRNADGKPVPNSEVALVAVDESVLVLAGREFQDPIASFYADRSSDVNDYHSRNLIKLLTADELSGTSTTINRQFVANFPLNGRSFQSLILLTPGTTIATGQFSVNGQRSSNYFTVDGLSSDVGTRKMKMRTDFGPLANFTPSARTDNNGVANIEVTLPDSLTRYRIIAVAAAGDKQFGKGESVITARKTLMVRPSPPRFLNLGDKFELPVMVQNMNDDPMSVDIAVRAINANLTAGAGRRVTVPGNDRVEVRFPATATQPGTAVLQIGAAGAANSADAAFMEIPVKVPVLTENFATYGEIDSGAVSHSLTAPVGVLKNVGGLQVSFSSSQGKQLYDGLKYMYDYPFACSEQLSSRLLAMIALRDNLVDPAPPGYLSLQKIDAAIARDLAALLSRQNDEGKFGLWSRTARNNESPYITVHASHAIQRAKEKGFKIRDEAIENARDYLDGIDYEIEGGYDSETTNALLAYALYVRNKMGDKDADAAREIVAKSRENALSLESMGWLLSVLAGDALSKSEVEKIYRALNNHVTETANTAEFMDSYSDKDYLLFHSSRRADGVILEALIDAQPESDLIPKLVRGLLTKRQNGHWPNTQDNAFALFALDHYFDVFESTRADFVARAWLGQQMIAQEQFNGPVSKPIQTNVPLKKLGEAGKTQNLIVSKEGTGRLYYRFGFEYALANFKQGPTDHGFVVERQYEAVDDPQDVRRDPNGNWHVKAGVRVRVKLNLVVSATRNQVALVDLLPAGFEILNPELKTTGELPNDEEKPKAGYWWWRSEWFDHQNLRDDRVEVFAGRIWEGIYSYSYVARATTPGSFIAPPPKAEEMYSPETFGSGRTDQVIIAP